MYCRIIHNIKAISTYLLVSVFQVKQDSFAIIFRMRSKIRPMNKDDLIMECKWGMQSRGSMSHLVRWSQLELSITNTVMT